MQERITIEALLQSKTVSGDTITLVLDVINAAATVPGTIITTCSTQEYATYLEQCRVHANTYIIASILMDSHEQVHVQWLAVPAMTQQVQNIVSDYRRSRRLQHLANTISANTPAPKTAAVGAPSDHADTPKPAGGAGVGEPTAVTREQPTVEPAPVTKQMKTSEIVLAALELATTNIQHAARKKGTA